MPRLDVPAAGLLLSSQIFVPSEGAALPEKPDVRRAVSAEAWRGQPARRQLAWVAAVTNVEVKKEEAEKRLTLLADAGDLLGLSNRSLKKSLRGALLGGDVAVAPTKQTFDHPNNHV